MWCTVYRLYLEGQRLPPEQARATGVHGWLCKQSKRPETGMPFDCAYLLPAPDAHRLNELIPPLDHCNLQFIRGGLRLNGQDWRVDHQFVRQSWWIVPDGQPDGEINA